MAFLLPIEAPNELVFNTRVFDIGRLQQISPGGGGYIQTFDRSTPMWFAELGTPPLNDQRYQQVQAFFDQLEGSANSFLCYDPRRPMPFAYRTQPVTADPWTQTIYPAPVVNAFDFANSTLTLGKMQNGAIISLGDYISFKIGNIWYLFRVTGGPYTVDSSNVIKVAVQPRPNLVGFVSGATPIRYRRPCFEGKIIGAPDWTDSVDSFPSCKFKVVQFINRSSS